MPIYEYQCEACDHVLDALQRFNEPPLKKCPECGKQKLKRLLSAPMFLLKGSGWYETDFKSEKERRKNLADRPEPDAKGADGKADAKIDGKSAAADAKAEGKPEVKSEGKSEGKSEAKSEAASDATSEGRKAEKKDSIASAGRSAARNRRTASPRVGKSAKPLTKPQLRRR